MYQTGRRHAFSGLAKGRGGKAAIDAPILKRFSAELPGVQLDLRLENSSNLLDLVAQHRVDIGIATLREPHPDFACNFLLDQRVEFLVHAGHPCWERGQIEAAELVGQRLFTREAGSMTRHLFETALADHGIEIAPHMILGSRGAVKEAGAAGIGIGTCSIASVASIPGCAR